MIRIQRSRQHKQISPNGLPIVYVGRPTKWGNPFDLKTYTRQEAITKYKEYLNKNPELVMLAKRELKGKNLSCWCKINEPCHADVLLEMVKE
jgi:hypothetical protein